MADKNFQINLAFTADTSQAKKQFQELQDQLNKLGSGQGSSSKFYVTEKIQEARTAATELGVHLQQALNQKTGTLDFSKLNQSIQQSGTTLQAYGKQLQSLGPEGQKAFMDLARAISNSEIPLKRTSALLDEFATTMKNTVRWQLSSSMMNGFVNSIQSAYNYAQSLDKSLTDIQIVAEKDANYMANFAEHANKAAQSLSTTTKTYADASLIYFQQGLTEEEVIKRTETTIKMAQATGDSVDQVSSYMTAVWNNFKDGSHTMEYYADVITKLGAATAASSSEIAEGIQKFAGIGDTIGLSYEYATSALTTLVANTRESASTIGNSLKTIFSRLQGLKLGETLEDGVDLNKYSQALQKIGVNILDANGELKEMDSILEETASKWDTLTQAQKMAFAQTTAGTMQYTKLISLLDNWDDMQENLGYASGSSGTLDRQAEIYAESWEGAKKRVQAAWEEIYNDLIDPDVFKVALNGLSGILGLVDKVIDSVGGLRGVLLGLGVIVTKVFQQQITQGLTTLAYNLNMHTKTGQEVEKKKRSDFLDNASQNMAQVSADENGVMSDTDTLRVKVFRDELELKNQLIEKTSQLNETEQLVAQQLLDQQKRLGEIAVQKQKAVDDAKQKQADSNDTLMERAYNRENDEFDSKKDNKFTVDTKAIAQQKVALKENVSALSQLDLVLEKVKKGEEVAEKEFQDFSKAMNTLSKASDDAANEQSDMHGWLQTLGSDAIKVGDKFDDLGEDSEEVTKNLLKMKSVIEDDLQYGAENLASLTGATGNLSKDQATNDYVDSLRNVNIAAQTASQAVDEYGATTGRAGQYIQTANGNTGQWANTLVAWSQVATQGIFLLSSLGSIWSTLNDQDMTPWEKTIAIFTTLTTLLPTIITLYDSYNRAKEASAAASLKEAFLNSSVVASLTQIGAKVKASISALASLILAKKGDTIATISETVAQELLNIAMGKMPTSLIIMGIIALTTAVIAASAAIYNLAKAFTNSGAQQLQDDLNDANQAVENFQEGLQNLEEKANELQSAWDEYTSITDALESCAKGTEAWNEQMQKLQEYINELLIKYPELSKYVTTDKNGNLAINEQGFEDIQNQLKQEKIAAQSAQNYANIKASEIKNQQTELYDEDIISYNNQKSSAEFFLKDGSSYLGKDGWLQYGLSDENVQQILNSADVSQDENLTSLAREIALKKVGYDSAEGDTKEEKMANLQSQYAHDASNGFFGFGAREASDGSQELNETIEQYTQDLLEGWGNWSNGLKEMDGAQKIADLKKSEDSVASQKQQFGQLTAGQLMVGQDYAKNFVDNEAFMEAAGKKYNDLVDSKIEELGEKENYNENFDDYTKEYLKNIEGIEGNITNVKKDKNGNITSYELNGEKQELDEVIAKDTILAYEGAKQAAGEFNEVMKTTFVNALNSSEESAKNYAKTVENVSNEQALQVGSAVKSFGFSGNLDDISYEENQALQQAGITKERIENKEVSAKDLGITDEDAINMGYDSAEAYIQAFAESIENNNTAFQIFNKSDLAGLSDQIKSQMTTGLAGSFEKIVSDMKLGPLGEKSGEELVKGMNSIFEGADTKEIQAGLEAIAKVDWTSDDAIKNLSSDLQELGLNVDISSDQWRNFESTMRQSYGTLVDFSSLSGSVGQVLSLQDAHAGDTISNEDLEPLLRVYPELSNYLIDVDDKTKAWTADFSTLVNTDFSGILGQMNQLKTLQEIVSDGDGLNLANLLSGMDTSSINDMKAGISSILGDDASTKVAESLGYTQEALHNLLATGSQEQLQTLYDSLNNFMNADYSITPEMAQSFANSAENIKELNELLVQGAFEGNIDVYNKKMQQLQNTLDEDIDVDEYEELADHIQDVAESSDDLDDSLKNNEKQSKKVASAILRYDSAIEKVSDSYDDWKKALNAGDLQEQAEVGKELENIYADMFDIDGSTLSDSFLTSTDNLELLKQAANGSQEAYAELQDRMQQDIEAQLNLDDTNFFDNKTAVETAMDEMSFEDIEVGASLDTGDFYSQLEDMINSAGMTAERATDYLASMGIDAELETVEKKEPVQKTVNSLTPDITYKDAVEPVVAGDGQLSTQPIKVPTITYNPTPETIEDTNAAGGFALKVKSANKSSGGSFKYKNSSNGGGSRRGSGGRGGRGGGGGGGRESRRNAEQKKNKNTEIERYHKIEKQIGSLEKQYDKISKAKDRAFGKSKLKLMDQEIAKQEQIIKKQKEYLQQAKDYLKIDKKNLQNGKTTYTDENGNEKTVNSGAKNYLGMEAKFDSDGNISNYDALMEAAVNKYNKAVEEFNKHNSDDEAAKAAFEAAKQQYEGFVQWIEQYEETQEVVDEKAQEVIDAQNAAYDLRFEKTQYTIELEIEVNDKQLEYLDYLLTRLEKYSGNEGKKISLLGEKTQNSLDRRDSVKKGLSDMLTNGNHPNLEKYDGNIVEDLMNGDEDAIALLSKEEFTDKEISFIKDKMSELLSINEALEESWNQIFDTMDEAFDNGVEKMDDILARQDHLMNMTNAWSDTIDILGKDFLGVTSESVQKLNQAKVTQSQNKYFSAKEKENTIKSNIDTTQAARNEAAQKRDEAIAAGKDDEAAAWDKDVQRYDESLKKYNEEYREAQEESATLFNESLQTMRDVFDSNLEAILDDFNKQAAGTAGSLEALLENMDQQKMVADRYVPEYERIYELTKLTRDVNKSIDETSNVKAKRELAKLQEEIVSLQESGKEQSEYDLEYLRKRYELKLAEVALEEAQNAKSQVRMTKDAEGNFSYVYTADENSMAEAEQAYEDKLYELQKMNDEYQQQLSQSMAETMQEYQEKYAQLADLYTVGSDEYNAALQKLQELYAGQMDYYSDQMNNVLTNNTTLYTQDVAKYADLTDNKAMKDQEYVGSFEQTSLAIAGGWKSQKEFMDNWEGAQKTTYEKAKANNENFKNSVCEFMKKAGISLEEFNQKLEEYTTKVSKDSGTLKQEMEQTSKKIQDNFGEIVKGVQEFERQYTIEIGKIITKNNSLYDSYMKVIKAHSTFTKTSNSGAGSDNDNTNKGNGEGGGDIEKNDDVVDNADKAEGVAAAIWIWGSKSGWGNDPERAKKLKAKGVSGAQDILNSKANSGYLYNKYWSKRNEVLNKYAYGKFDTGGYTGDWDGEGKFAMLHQKEIVLNKDDTANFLKTVDIVRQISEMIDLNAMSASGGLGSLFAASVNKDAETLEQTVHITAEFPNATNKNEILDAFDNIVNLASQYANKKR